MYIYIYMYLCMYAYIYIYIYQAEAARIRKGRSPDLPTSDSCSRGVLLRIRSVFEIIDSITYYSIVYYIMVYHSIL